MERGSKGTKPGLSVGDRVPLQMIIHTEYRAGIRLRCYNGLAIIGIYYSAVNK